MKGIYVFQTVIIGFLLIVFARYDFATQSDVKQADPLKNGHRIQVPFIENRGHVKNSKVRFFATTYNGFATIYVEENGTLSYNFSFKNQKSTVIKEMFTDKNISITPQDPLSPQVIQLFKEKMNLQEDISNYYRMSLGEIYENINLELNAFADTIEKFLTILPGGDPDKIRITLQGVRGLKIEENGKLELIMPLGSGKFNKPFAFQISGDDTKVIEVSYFIDKNNVYGFKVGNYDKKKPLFIRF